MIIRTILLLAPPEHNRAKNAYLADLLHSSNTCHTNTNTNSKSGSNTKSNRRSLVRVSGLGVRQVDGCKVEVQGLGFGRVSCRYI